MKHAALILLLLSGVVMTSPHASAEKTPKPAGFPDVSIEVGASWPGFYLPDREGKPLSVQDYRGKKVVLHIFASW